MTRRDFLFLLGIGALSTSSLWIRPLLQLTNWELSQSLKQFDESYDRISATAIAQEKNESIEIPDIVKKASVSISFNGEGGCSATNIYTDWSNDVSVFLTAKHCLPSEDIFSFSINQPHLPDTTNITVSSSDIATVEHWKKDLALIAIHTPFSSISWEPVEVNPDYDFPNSIDSQFCALSFPKIGESKTPIGMITSLDRTWTGAPSLSENRYQLEAAIWFDASGSGVIDCQTFKVVGVLSELNLKGEGQAVIENLDLAFFENFDQLLSEFK